MKISKIFSAVAASAALIAASFTAFPGGAATAASATPNLYNMNIANQSSTGDAADFVTDGTYTYFAVNTVTNGRSIWRVGTAANAVPELVADVAQGSAFGQPMGLTLYSHYLFFWDDSTSSYDGYRPYVVDVNTKIVTELLDENEQSLSSEYYGLKFAGVGDKVYFYAESNRDADANLRSFDLTNPTVATTAREDMMNFDPDGSIVAFENKLFVVRKNSDWNRKDSVVKMYDIATQTWSDVTDTGSNNLVNVGLAGVFSYDGKQQLLVNAAGAYYAIDNTLQATRLGAWSVPYGAGFVNIGSDLYTYYSPNWGEAYAFNKVDASNGGTLVSMNSTMFPGSTSVRVVSPSVANNKMFFAATLNGTGKEHLYIWDGTNAATQIGSYEPLGVSVYFAEYHAAGGWGRNEASGTIGNSGVMNLALEDSVGYEPYKLNPDGTVTLVKNFNSGSEGSSPNPECSVHTPNGDYIQAQLPLLNSDGGVIVHTQSDGTNLKYSVISIGDYTLDACGFVLNGTDLYFTAWTRNVGDRLYKMNTATDVITEVGQVNERAFKATIVNNKYYYFSDDSANLRVYDLATGDDKALTGDNGSTIYDDSLDDQFFLGTKAYFTAEDQSSGDDFQYVVDLAAATYTETKFISSANATNHNPRGTVALGSYIYYADDVDRNGYKIYKAPLTGGTASVVYNISANGSGWVGDMRVVGTDIYIPYYNDNANKGEMYRLAGGTTASKVSLPNDASSECVANLGGVALFSDANTGAAYTASGSTVTDLGFRFGDGYSVCYAEVSPYGLYLSNVEYPFINGGPFDYELAYFGKLVPVAVSRLGVAVNEGPSAPAGGLPTVEPVLPGAISGLTVTVGSAAINLSWTAPSTGTTPQYMITSTPSGAVCSITGTTASCTGTAGVSYTFTVKAGNEAGLSEGVTTAAVKAPGASAVNPDDPNISSVTESKVVKAVSGPVTFPDGSGFDIDSKGRLYFKISSKFLTSTTATIVVSYKVGKAAKTYTCKVKAFGSLKKLKKVPTKNIISKTKQACQLPTAALSALKTSSVTIKATASVKRYYATTAKAKTPAGKAIKVLTRKMTVTMGKGAK